MNNLKLVIKMSSHSVNCLSYKINCPSKVTSIRVHLIIRHGSSNIFIRPV